MRYTGGGVGHLHNCQQSTSTTSSAEPDADDAELIEVSGPDTSGPSDNPILPQDIVMGNDSEDEYEVTHSGGGYDSESDEESMTSDDETEGAEDLDSDDDGYGAL